MKFTFEADMVRGQCYCCPLLYFDDEGFEHCGLGRSITCLEVEPSECPLKEANEVNWHPYPEEKPTRSGFYLVTPKSGIVCSIPWVEEQGWSITVGIKAWAECPRPYGGNK